MADLTPRPVPVPRTRPLVFVGPSISRKDVLALLPDAEIREPVRRGDLYAARLLRYSAFIVLDGVFTQSEAISPREVVDVISDGAVFLGGASMGALRAADCGPAGAQGAGAVWRMFRRGTLASEDEVAVLFLPERPFPALTLALVNARFALRRAVRAQLLAPGDATALIRTAEAMHYGDRTWPAIFKGAGLALDKDLIRTLTGWDVKHADARATLRQAARQMQNDPGFVQRPRTSRSTFGLLEQGRAHLTDPLLGQSAKDTDPGFLLWMVGSGRAPVELRRSAMPLLAPNKAINWIENLDRVRWEDIGPEPAPLQVVLQSLIARLDQDGRLDAERLRHLAVARAARTCAQSGTQPDDEDINATTDTIFNAHGVADLTQLGVDYGRASTTAVTIVWDCWAHAKAMRRLHKDLGEKAWIT